MTRIPPPARALSQLDAFFVAYQERAGISMQLGVEIHLDGRLSQSQVEVALATAIDRWPQLGQRLQRRVLGLSWSGNPRLADMLHVETGADLDAWRNRTIDPFREPPFQLLWCPNRDGSVFLFRSHHAVVDGESFFAVVVTILQTLGGATIRASHEPAGDLFDARRLHRRIKWLSMWRYARWLVAESKSSRSTRLTLRSERPGNVAITEAFVAGALQTRVLRCSEQSGITPAMLLCAAWVRAIGQWNARRTEGEGDVVSIEMPVSIRRGTERDGCPGNYVSPLVLFASSSSELLSIAAALRKQLRQGLRRQSYLAMPLLTSPGRYLPWPIFRRVAANTSFTGFATTHFTWIDDFSRVHQTLADSSDGALTIHDQRIYTPVCLHMGAALAVIPWPGGWQLCLTHRLTGIDSAEAQELLQLLLAQLEL